jgi:hypothetical protein
VLVSAITEFCITAVISLIAISLSNAVTAQLLITLPYKECHYLCYHLNATIYKNAAIATAANATANIIY